jgi:GntR family transcriptional regulator / MocR family aminotransferase
MLKVQTNLAWDTLLPIEEGALAHALHVRLTSALRDAIRLGKIPVGSALPPSRQLATDLRCSRWVVTEAYEQLVAEGYLEARVGSGTRVRLRDHQQPEPKLAATDTQPALRFDLTPGLPDFNAFPRSAWSRCIHDTIATMSRADLDYQSSGGHPRLRRVLREYLGRVRGAVVHEDDVTVTSGILDGLSLLLRALVTADRVRVAIEDPCWRRLVAAVQRSGLQVIPIEVDAEGMQTGDLSDVPVDAAIVAPAHQFPTGMVLTPERRMLLLEWARAADGLVLEDDYDAEFRYDRRPVGVLQGIDPAHVALFGSLSKTLAPGVGIGWVVTPPRWTEALRSVEARLTGPSTVEQLALAGFIETGAYDRHLRALRRGYRARRDLLVRTITRRLPQCRIFGAAAGLHVLMGLPVGVTGEELTAELDGRGIRVLDLRSCNVGLRRRRAGDLPREGIVFGYGNLPDEQVEPVVDEMGAAIRSLRS